ncbi:MFS transporter, partial [Piscirickettsia salmonis]|uniref:MFS transporter n=1 Tax=Piscirickettsia salmonis TaxID=1238 RepID=UPI003EC09F34
MSYLSRPVGAYLFGLYSDKKGRKYPLITSSFLMGLSTIAIGLIPSYQQIGIIAPILLLIFRLIQSLSISGEFNNSSIFLMEHNPAQQTIAGSWIGMASSAGMFVGGLIAVIIGLTSNLWSWRVAYIAIGVTSLLLMLLRYKLQESPLFININKKNLSDFSLKKMFFDHKKGLLKIACISAFMSVYIYT